jgi:hypothetical protein
VRLGIGVPRAGQVEIHREHLRRVEAMVDGAQVEKAACEQGGCQKQHERQRDLRGGIAHNVVDAGFENAAGIRLQGSPAAAIVDGPFGLAVADLAIA